MPQAILTPVLSVTLRPAILITCFAAPASSLTVIVISPAAIAPVSLSTNVQTFVSVPSVQRNFLLPSCLTIQPFTDAAPL